MTRSLTIAFWTNYSDKEFSVAAVCVCPLFPQVKPRDGFNSLKGDLVVHCQCVTIQSQHGYNTEQTALTNLIN